MRRLVFNEQPMVMAVPGDTSIAEQRAYQDCLLELGQLARLCLDFPRRHPTRSIGWDFHRYSRVWHRRYRRRGQDPYPGRSPSFRARASRAGPQIAFATGVTSAIYALYRYTRDSI